MAGSVARLAAEQRPVRVPYRGRQLDAQIGQSRIGARSLGRQQNRYAPPLEWWPFALAEP